MQIEQVASTDATVLKPGGPGTGEELIVRAVHNISNTSKRLLVKVSKRSCFFFFQYLYYISRLFCCVHILIFLNYKEKTGGNECLSAVLQKVERENY